ncbi:hypothetical protein [Archangium violaceum]|uniref:hypothetical protein n=1 Tax=Archangium violaceum TaxID=83451 RepID=UPI0036DD0DFD
MTEAVEALAGAGQQGPGLAGAVVFRGVVASLSVRCVGSKFLWTQGAGMMNCVRVAAWMLMLTLETGCPVGGGAGILHQALLRDEINRLVRESCRPADVWAACGPEDYEDCMEDCRGEMEKRGWK